jgi:phosphoribosylaminoimidazole-succinocarboxamide synthase
LIKTLLYEGKAKKVYAIEGHENNGKVFIEFKNSLTAFNALKKGEFEGKGEINRDIATFIFKFLESKKVKTHWVKDIGSNSMVTHQLQIIPLEVVVRNTLAGSTAKKFGRNEGSELVRPLVEFYYKNDALEDPLVTEDQADILGFCDLETMSYLKTQALKINALLVGLFQKAKLHLVDFKVEFGKNSNNEVLLADEISPDCCRLWDLETKEKMDKDRFRRDLGHVKEVYVEVLNRLKKLKEEINE